MRQVNSKTSALLFFNTKESQVHPNMFNIYNFPMNVKKNLKQEHEKCISNYMHIRKSVLTSSMVFYNYRGSSEFAQVDTSYKLCGKTQVCHRTEISLWQID